MEKESEKEQCNKEHLKFLLSLVESNLNVFIKDEVSKSNFTTTSKFVDIKRLNQIKNNFIKAKDDILKVLD